MKLTQSIQQAYRMRFPANSLRKRFAEGMTWVIAGTSVRQAANFLAGIIVARLLGVADFGKLAVVQSTVLMLANFGQAGIGLASTQHVASLRTLEPERTGRIIGFSLAFTYVFALLMGMLLSLFSSWIAQRIVFEIISMLQLRILTGLEAFRSSAMINLCQGVLLLPIMYYGASYGGVLGSVLALTGVSVVGSIIGHFILRAKCGCISRNSAPSRMLLISIFMS